MTLLTKFSVVFELPTGTVAVADVPSCLSALFDLVEIEPSFVETFPYYLTLISRSHFRFHSVEGVETVFCFLSGKGVQVVCEFIEQVATNAYLLETKLNILDFA